MTIIKNGCGGITFGIGEGLGICTDGVYYYCFKFRCYSRGYDVIYGKNSTNVELNESNIIGIFIAKNRIPLLFFNGQVIPMSRPIYSFGEWTIGLMVMSITKSAVEVAYKDAKVWTF